MRIELRSLCPLLPSVDAAVSDAEHCVALKPDWPKAHFRLAAAHKAGGRFVTHITHIVQCAQVNLH